MDWFLFDNGLRHESVKQWESFLSNSKTKTIFLLMIEKNNILM